MRDSLLNTNDLTQEELENLNRPITSKEIELVIKPLSAKRSPGQVASLVNFTKHLKMNEHESFSNSFRKGKGETTSQRTLSGQHYPDTDTRQRNHKTETTNQYQ